MELATNCPRSRSQIALIQLRPASGHVGCSKVGMSQGLPPLGSGWDDLNHHSDQIQLPQCEGTQVPRQIPCLEGPLSPLHFGGVSMQKRVPGIGGAQTLGRLNAASEVTSASQKGPQLKPPAASGGSDFLATPVPEPPPMCYRDERGRQMLRSLLGKARWSHCSTWWWTDHSQ